MSKAKSMVSFAKNIVDNKRAVAFNHDLKTKISYEWKNIYRSLLQCDVF